MDAVTYLFATDVKETAERTPLLFVDAYEALIGGAARAGRTAAVDAWLRDLVAQFDSGLVVIASREAVNWHRYNAAWAGLTRTVPVEGLPAAARIELLQAMGITDENLATSIARVVPACRSTCISRMTPARAPGPSCHPRRFSNGFCST